MKHEVAMRGMEIVVILTCHNRRQKTEQCIRGLGEGNKGMAFRFVAVDDGSTDGTTRMLENLGEEHYNIEILHGNGELFYSQGMRKGMLHVIETGHKADYVMLVNDDVEFYDGVVPKLVCQSRQKGGAVIVGATSSRSGGLTYGGIKYRPGTIKYEMLGTDSANVPCDTFNGNCVLLPYGVFAALPVMDGFYQHIEGDFDYGLSCSKLGFPIFTSNFYVGVCERNSEKNTWSDISLPRIERLKKKEGPKGMPFKIWFYYLKKNFGLRQALLHSLTPYIKIIFKIR